MAAGIEAILQLLYGFYNTIFQPLLAAGPYVSLGFFSGVLAFVFSLIYWWLLDIERADEIKEKISEKQEEMKEARKNGESDEASTYMQKTMELNQRLMMLNIKPMIATMIFVGLIFPWLGATFAPSIDLTTQDNQSYTGEWTYAGNTKTVTVVNNTEPRVELNGDEAKVGESLKAYGVEWDVKKFGEKTGGFFSSSEGTRLKLNAAFVRLPFKIPVVAGDELNWLGFYILIAMPLTFLFRKLLGVA